MHVVAYLSEDSVHILIDEVFAFDGIVRMEVFPQARDLAGAQRRVAVATRPQQLFHCRRVELDLVPPLTLRYNASRHTALVTIIPSSSTMHLISVCINLEIYGVFTMRNERNA